MDPISPTDRDLAIRTVLAEAGENGGALSQSAVANVIKNRYASGQYGNSISDIILAPSQFEPWKYAGKAASDPKANDPLRFSPDSDAYKKAGAIVDEVMAGGPDPTFGATHFVAPKAQADLGRDLPAWAQSKPLASIGGQNYFAPQGAVKPSGAIAKMDATQTNPYGLPAAQTQNSPLMALLQGMTQKPAGAATPAGYSPNLIGQTLFGPGGARGMVNQAMPQGALGGLSQLFGTQPPQGGSPFPGNAGGPTTPGAAVPPAGIPPGVPPGATPLGPPLPGVNMNAYHTMEPAVPPGGVPQLPMGGNGIGLPPAFPAGENPQMPAGTQPPAPFSSPWGAAGFGQTSATPLSQLFGLSV